jgi:hypothetical protein
MMPQQAAAARPTATPPTQYVGNMCVCVSLLCVCALRACVCTHAQTNNRAASSLRNDFASGTCMIPSRNALRLLLRSRGTVCELCSPAKVVDCGIRSLQSSCEWLKAVPQANLSLHTGLLRAHGTRGFASSSDAAERNSPACLCYVHSWTMIQSRHTELSAASQSTVTCRRGFWAQPASQICANCCIWHDPCCGNQGGAADVWVSVGSMRHKTKL